MDTKIFKFNNISKDEYYKKLNEAAKIIKSGGLVAIPTETVYGLAANGLDKKAVSRIFEAKKRPSDNPLILHVSNINQVKKYSKGLSKIDEEILNKLWPGPLTVILEKSDNIPEIITAGGNTVALRIPDKQLTLDFIDTCGLPLAAPSANISTKPSTTNIDGVIDDFFGVIEGIIDGDISEIGLESTVLDLTADSPTILRPGYYTKEMLEEYWEKVVYDPYIKNLEQVPKSPGQKYKHYAPDAKVTVFVGSVENVSKELYNYSSQSTNKIGIMTFEEDKMPYEKSEVIYMGSINNLETMGKYLFTNLRKLDSLGVDEILVFGVEEREYGLTIMNRLKKSSSGNIIYL